MKKLAIILAMSLFLQYVTPMSVCAAETDAEKNVGIPFMTFEDESMNESGETATEGASEEEEASEGLSKEDESSKEDENSEKDISKEDETSGEEETEESNDEEFIDNEDSEADEDIEVAQPDAEINATTDISTDTVDTQNAIEIEGFIQAEYYMRDEGYSLFIGAAMPEWETDTTELTNVAYQLDSSELVVLGTVLSDKFEYYKPNYTWSENYGGCLTLSLDSMPADATEGTHLLTVYFSVSGIGYKIVGTTELVDELKNEGTAWKWSDNTEYISSRKDAFIEMLYARGYTFQKDEKFIELQLLPSGSNEAILTASASYADTYLDSDYGRYSIYDNVGKDGLSYTLSKSVIPDEYFMYGWFNAITLTDDIAEGYYDMLVVTSTGRKYIEKNAYYASSKPIIYNISRKYKEEIFSDDTGDYVSVFVYGLNLDKNTVPIFYDTGDSAVLARYIDDDPECGYEQGNKWGNYYRLKKTSADLGVGKSVSSHAIINGDVVYANGKEYCGTKIEIEGIFAEEYLESGELYDGSPARLRLYIGEGIDCNVGDIVTYEMQAYLSFNDMPTYTETAKVKSNGNGKYIEFDETSDIYTYGLNRWNFKLIKGTETLTSSTAGQCKDIRSAQSLEVPAGCSWEVHAIGEITNTIYNGTNTDNSTASVLTDVQLSKLANQGTVRVCIYNADGTVRERRLVCFVNNSGDELVGITIDKIELASNITISKDKSALYIIDGRTGAPISGVRVWIGGSEHYTGEDGIVQMTNTGLWTIQIDKNGYHKKSVKKNLVKGKYSTIILCPDTGNVQILSATLNLIGEDEDVLNSDVYLTHKKLSQVTDGFDATFKLTAESAGDAEKYQLIQNGKVIQQNETGIFEILGKYSYDKNGNITYYVDELSAGYKVYVKVYDGKKSQTQELGIKVSEASSSILNIKGIDSDFKVELGDKLEITIPSSIPLVGGSVLNFGFEEDGKENKNAKKFSLSATVDDNGKVKVALNVKKVPKSDEDWDNIKKEYKNLSKKASKALKDRNLTSFGAGTFSIDGDIMGYGEGYVNDISDSVCINVGVVITVKGEAEYTQYFLPVFITFGGGISFTASGELNFMFDDDGWSRSGASLEIKPSIYAKLNGGLGVEGSGSVGAYGKLTFSWLHRFSDNYNQVALNGNAKIKLTAFNHEIPLKGKELDGTWIIYDSNNKSTNAVNTLSLSDVSYIDMSDAELLSMDYLTRRKQGVNLPRASDYSANIKTSDSTCILSYAYEDASPRLIQVGNKLYLFYLDGVEGRSAQNQTALFYCISSDNGTTWSKAVRVDGGANETADYDYDVATNGNDIYVIWSDAGKVYDDEILLMDSSDAINMIGKEMNLMLAVIDGSIGTINTRTIATGNADLQPQLVIGNNGTVYAAWITNDVSSEDGLFSNKNRMGICYASSEDNYTVHSLSLSGGYYPLTLDAGILGSEICIAVDLDTDGNLNTQEDREIYTFDLVTGGELTAQTVNEMTDSVPLFGKVAESNCLFWYQDGNIAYTDGKKVSMVSDLDAIPSMGQEFSLLEGNNGNAVIVWTTTSLTEDVGVDVYCADFDGIGWSEVYKLGKLDSEYTTFLDGFLDDSVHRMVYLSSIYENKELYSHICMYTPSDRIDTDITWYAETDGTPGEEYPITLTVTNSGNAEVNSLSIVSADGNIQDTITGISIAPGTSKELIWNGIRLPNEMTEVYDCSLTVTAVGETYTDDNIISISVGAPDFSVEVYSDYSSGEHFAGIEVANNGILSSDAVLIVYKDEEHTNELYRTSLTNISGGESKVTIFDLNVLDEKSQIFYFVISDASGKEIYTDDNETFLYIGKGIYMEYDEIGGGPGNNPGDDSDNNSEDDSEGVLQEDIPEGGIPKGLWIAGIDPNGYTYTGKAIKPEVRVYDSNKRLKVGQDYTISYKNNTKANNASNAKSAPTVVVKGKGNYSGTETVTFKILPIDLSDTCVITEDITLAYNEKVQKKVPTVTYNGKKLANNKDFTVFYPALTQGVPDAFKAVGIYDIVLTAKEGGSFTGERTVKLTITNATLISKVTVKKIPNQTYTGNAIEPELTVTMKNVTLEKEVDYTVAYMDNTEVGTATAILTGIGDYAGVKKVTFKITGISVKNAELNAFQDKLTYNGSEQMQSVLVVVNNTILEEGTDYDVSYANNTNAGNASIIIKGKGAYTGMKKQTFKILPCGVSAATDLSGDITVKYVKGGSKPELELTYAGKKLTEEKDYTISYKNNNAVTTAETRKYPEIIVKGKGNFTGTLTKYFTITSKALNDTVSPVTLSVADKGFIDKAGKYISNPVLTDVDGKKLVAGKDYEKAVVYTLEDGTVLSEESIVYAGTNVKVKVMGKGAYTGELEGTYRITENDFSKAKISINPQIYTGKAITLEKDDITVKIGNDILIYGTDYEIVEDSYINNIKKGTASVTIVGKGNYGGTKIVKYKITAQKFAWFWRIFG